MSIRSKFSSNTSTPAKFKRSQASGSVSSVKSFLTSVLTPHSKRWIKKKSSKSDKSLGEGYHGAKNSDHNDTFHDFNDPNYSSIEELHLSHLSPGELKVKAGPSYSPEVIDNVDLNPSKIVQEPVYAIINKQKKNKDFPFIKEHRDDTNNASGSREISDLLNSSPKPFIEHLEYHKNDKENDYKEEIRFLKERLKDVTNKNKELHKHVEDLLKETKWKEDSLHAELKLKISQFEAETHKEVNSLSEQVKALQKERKALTDEIDILFGEKKALKAQYDDLCAKTKLMMSPELVAKTIDKHQRSIKELERKYQDEMQELKNEKSIILESKISLSTEVDVLREKLQAVIVQHETLKASEQEHLKENGHLLLQLNNSKQMSEDTQNLLMALLKLTENISIERDVLLDKVSYHDNQQSLIRNSIMDYSLNMGRLQEHVSNFNKEKIDEIQKLKISDLTRDENLKYFYNEQLELLRSKVLNQCSTINDLESEKSKLEMQLESLFQAACMGRPKLLEDLKYNL